MSEIVPMNEYVLVKVEDKKTEGVYFVGNSKLPLHFFLKKIKQNDLDIEIEYDIYSHEQLLSCNTLEIEVKKC